MGWGGLAPFVLGGRENRFWQDLLAATFFLPLLLEGCNFWNVMTSRYSLLALNLHV